LSLSWATTILSTPPQPISKRSTFILSTYLRLGLRSGLFPSGFPTITSMHFSFPPFGLHVPPTSSSLT
jgi:hypothetical protein